MNHLKYLGIKFIVIGIAILSIYGMFDHVPIPNLIIMSAIATGVSYIIGDALILRRYGNLAATIADFVLMAGTLWALSLMFVGPGQPILLPTLFSSYFILFCEPFIHAYILENEHERKAHDENEEHHAAPALHQARLQTEFAEENNADDLQKKDD
ncbi:YndM family protein [Virgibacillus sp. 179-BFC.A HS]|uniref:YndM family protein n=1 Tax=Tigheibacillus jepli TaxID=3035914 RepID=A0ABU5CL16_9BACI|nr:YndM family protein [Virgibacillus sp. 179-BFC.A HS]MDY0407043.1 YndM family protein [Virgibacillus sp. 179-BFC.A HS]